MLRARKPRRGGRSCAVCATTSLMPIRTDEDVKIVPKGWGEERWLHNDELYCGKILIVNEGKRCSLRYHQLKTETFYIQQGRGRMELTDLKAGRETPPVILEEF